MKKICEVIEIVTPKKYVLNGLWFGGKKAKTAIIFIHGLTSTAFSSHKFITPLAKKDTAVVFFSNRGHDKVSRLKKIDKRRTKGYKSEMIGEVHEVFSECVDDIQGAINFVKTRGTKNFFLVGHSTGCQKAVYYLSQRKKQNLVKGMILMSPMSDYAAALKSDKNHQLKKATKVAKKLVKEGKLHKILPLDVWPHMHDAQRFLSLYTPDSKEEIFSYCQPNKNPKTFKSIKIPMLIILAEKDEFKDRPIKRIEKWFANNSNSKDLQIFTVRNAPHSFQKFENKVSKRIACWLRENPKRQV